jgi:hypothetical protein
VDINVQCVKKASKGGASIRIYYNDSGTTTFDLDIDEIIQESYNRCGV